MTEIIIMPFLFLSVSFVVWTILREIGRRSRLKLLIEFRLRVLDRLTSEAEIGALLREQSGHSWTPDEDQGFVHRTLANLQAGTAALCLAAGFGVLAFAGPEELREYSAVLAVLVAALGTGLLLSAIIAWRVGRGLGLLHRDGD